MVATWDVISRFLYCACSTSSSLIFSVLPHWLLAFCRRVDFGGNYVCIDWESAETKLSQNTSGLLVSIVALWQRVSRSGLACPAPTIPPPTLCFILARADCWHAVALSSVWLSRLYPRLGYLQLPSNAEFRRASLQTAFLLPKPRLAACVGPSQLLLYHGTHSASLPIRHVRWWQWTGSDLPSSQWSLPAAAAPLQNGTCTGYCNGNRIAVSDSREMS